MGGPTLRDKRPEIKNTTAIQRCSPRVQHGGTARTTPRLAAHRQFQGALGADSLETSTRPGAFDAPDSGDFVTSINEESVS
ncbi:hypothetical protein D3260_03115 [Salinisphaera sp. Q1T1-3]|nr:hypothetical protein D3260_03115 [Salinisphaera sp. Q1T1-3]